VVPTGSAWSDSYYQFVVYNPESLLIGTLDKPELVSEFLFGYGSNKYKTDDTIEMSLGVGKVGYINLYAMDSVFRNLELPSDSTLKVEVSDSSVASVLVENGRLKITNKKSSTFELKVVYSSSKQQPFAYGKIKVNVKSYSYPRDLSAYIADMCDINGQFKMGRTEVTVAMWKEYCAATGKSMPVAPNWGWIDSHPVVNVTWYDCKDYAGWAGLRLPTATEWELAASGGDGRTYPWGNNWDHTKCVNRRVVKRMSTEPVGSIPAGDSPFGCSDMSGNASEWCADDFYPGKEYRGGSWYDPEFFMFWCARRHGSYPDSGGSLRGFRLAGPI
jgi:hypothetical protein